MTIRILDAILRTASLAGSVLAFYASFFLRPDEEGKLQDRVDRLWVEINDAQKFSGGRTAAMFNRVASAVSGAFDRVFGPKLFSVQMAGVSSSLSFAGLFLLGGFILGFLGHRLKALPSLPPNLPADMGTRLLFLSAFCLTVGLALFVIAALPSAFPSRLSRFLSLAPALVLTAGLTKLAQRHMATYTQAEFFAALLVSMFVDMSLLVGVRRSVRWISRAPGPGRISMVILAQITAAVVVVWVPAEFGGAVGVSLRWRGLSQFLVAIAAFNIFTAVAALAFALALTGLLVRRAFWPVIDRALYPAARWEIVRNHKAMATIGAGLLLLACPSLNGLAAAMLAFLLAIFSGKQTPHG